MMDKIMTVPTASAMGRVAATARSESPAHSEAKGASKSRKGASESEFSKQMAAQATSAGAFAQAKAISHASVSHGKLAIADSKQNEAKSSSNAEAANHAGLSAARLASTKTGARNEKLLAGLQPRNASGKFPADSPMEALREGAHGMKDWVFDGIEGNPNLEALFASRSRQAGHEIAERMKGAHAAAEKAGVGTAAAGRNLLKGIQPGQVRGEMATAVAGAKSRAMPAAEAEMLRMSRGSHPAESNAFSSAAAMASTHKGDALSHAMAGGVAQGGLPGHLSHVEFGRPQGSAGGTNGNVALSGAEFLGTLSSLHAGKHGGSNAGGGSGSFGQEGERAGMRLGVGQDGLKKTRFGSSQAQGTESLFQSTVNAASAHPSLSGVGGTGTNHAAASTQMQAQVTTGAMAQDRLASASLFNLTNNIRNLTPQGGGEIRVRLHPENLGELHLRVVTNGKEVGIQIQASDEKAKKILEQSLNDLKDNLAKHHMSLAQIDIAVGQAQGAFSGHLGGEAHQQQHSQQGSFAQAQDQMRDMLGGGQNHSQNQWGGAREGASSRDGWEATPLRTAAPGARIATQATRSSAGGMVNRRLDIRA